MPLMNECFCLCYYSDVVSRRKIKPRINSSKFESKAEKLRKASELCYNNEKNDSNYFEGKNFLLNLSNQTFIKEKHKLIKSFFFVSL